MPSSRRRFLAASTAAAAAIAGCSDGTAERDIDETVTPVDVPQSDVDLLEEAAAIERPEVSPAVVVIDDHLAAAARQVESNFASVEALVAEVDLDEPESRGPSTAGVDRRMRRAEEALADHRHGEHESGIEALQSLRSILGDLGHLVGVLRAASGEADAEELDEAIQRRLDAEAELSERFHYRIARPVADRLPTLHAAAPPLGDGLERAREIHDHIAADAEARDDPAMFGRVHRDLALHRRRIDDAERWLEWATDPEAPSSRDGLEDALSDLADVAEDIAAEYEDDDPPDGATLAAELRGYRHGVGVRDRRIAAEATENLADGRPLVGTLEALEWLVRYESLDAGVEMTVDLLDSGESPSEGVLDAKRQAVERVEALAEASAIVRDIGAKSEALLQSGDRFQAGGPNDEPVANAYFQYVAAGEWAERAAEHGIELSARLRAEQS